MPMMTRNEFLKWLGGGVALTALAACGDGDSTPVDAGPDAPAGCTVTDAKIEVAEQHVHAPHMVVVSPADVMAAADKTYDIQGSASHNHQITITAAQFTMLQGGGSIMVTSTDGLGHTHVVTVSC